MNESTNYHPDFIVRDEGHPHAICAKCRASDCFVQERQISPTKADGTAAFLFALPDGWDVILLDGYSYPVCPKDVEEIRAVCDSAIRSWLAFPSTKASA